MSAEETDQVKVLLERVETLTRDKTELTRQLAAKEESADDLTSEYVEDAIYESRKELRPATIRRQEQDRRNFHNFLAQGNLQPSPKSAVDFFKHLKTEKKRPFASIEVARAAVNKKYPAIRKNPSIKRIFAAWRKESQGQHGRAAPAITHEHFLMLLEVVGHKSNFSTRETERWESEVSAQLRAKRWKAQLTMLHGCCNRFSDAKVIEWEDVDENEDGTGRVCIRQTKTSDTPIYKTVPVATMVAFRDYRDYVEIHNFGAKRPKRLERPFFQDVSNFNRDLQDWCDLAGISVRYTSHSFRNAAAHYMADNGLTDFEAIQVGGWKNPSMYYRYNRTNPNLGKGMAKILPKTYYDA